MKHGNRPLVVGLDVVALAVTLALIAARGQASTAVNGIIYVDADAGGENNGTSWADAYTDLQLALGAAVPGNEIWVAAGTYTPTQESSPGDPRSAAFQMKNGVAIYGGFDPSVDHTEWEDRDWVAHPTILSGDLDGDDGPDFENNDENSYHVFYHPDGTNLDSTAILDGFTITGGNHGYGGGMANYNSSPALTNCAFEANSGYAMYNFSSSPILTNCAFQGNSGGGGMYNNGSSPTLTDCTFEDNYSPEIGGGMYNQSYSSPKLINCIFEDNRAGTYGGGMYNASWSSPTLTNCAFTGNWAYAGGGGMHNWGSSSPVLTNCTFSGNSVYSGDGGGMHNYTSSPALTNCTFYSNSARDGGGMYNTNSSPTLTNCILWNDTSSEIYNSSGSPVVTYSDIQGGYTGETNIDEDPLFVDPAGGDYHLQLDSPCIDVGNNDAPALPGLDFDREPRILDGDEDGIAIVDMGVDEVAIGWPYARVHLPLVFRGR